MGALDVSSVKELGFGPLDVNSSKAALIILDSLLLTAVLLFICILSIETDVLIGT